MSCLIKGVYLSGPVELTVLRPTVVMLQDLETWWNTGDAKKFYSPSFFSAKDPLLTFWEPVDGGRMQDGVPYIENWCEV